jgi:hypothetical protein
MPRLMLRDRLRGTLLVLLLMVMLVISMSPPVRAAGSQLQSTTAVGGSSSGVTSVTATFTQAATANDLLIVACSATGSVTFTTPSGYTLAKTDSATVSQAVFYKVAAGGETAATCSVSAKAALGETFSEYSGMAATAPLDVANPTSATGTGTSLTTGSLTTTVPSDLLYAAVATVNTAGSTAISTTWTNSFTNQQASADSYSSGHGKSVVTTYLGFGVADRFISATGSYASGTTSSASGTWVGQTVAFKVNQTGSLTADIVDGTGASVANPTFSLSATTRSFSCQAVTGTMGTSSEKIRISNGTANQAWTLALAATNGPTSSWSSGSSHYDFNDPTSSGCTDGTDADSYPGQLSINPAVGSVTPQTGCVNTGVTLGTSAAFNEGVLNSITLATASTAAAVNCYWDITNIALSQTIPASQPAGSYSLGLTLTLTAN